MRTENPSDLVYDDYSTAEMNILFSKAFFAEYSNYLSNPLYLAGESYAGIYVPYLAYLMDLHNSDSDSDDFKFNLKGYMVGNGVTDFSVDNYSAIEYYENHAVLSPSFSSRIKEHHCRIIGPGKKSYQKNKMNQTLRVEGRDPYCFLLETELYTSIANLNLYNLIEDCSLPHSGCVDDTVLINYLNRDDVKAALHVEEFIGQWSECSDPIFEFYRWNLPGSIQVYPHMMEEGYKILKYSGDADSMVPFNGSVEWIAKLNLDVLEPWRQWFISSDPNQPAGYIEVYDGMTFATVRNAGHLVPQTKGAQLNHLIKSFIQDEAI
mmetsp:Transcript_54555/g.62542  ORF Transcript_54555/g.62542 Transcript_54555/m.62542 type:complete len:321 (+) Transcript_54555:40-1002(+)